MRIFKKSVNGSSIETIVEKPNGFNIVRGKVMSLALDVDVVRFSIEKETRGDFEQRSLFVNVPPDLKNHRVVVALSAAQVAYEECARLIMMLDAIEGGDLGFEVEGLINENELDKASLMIELAYHVKGQINPQSIKFIFDSVNSLLRPNNYAGNVRSLRSILGLSLIQSLRNLAATYYGESSCSFDHLIRAIDEFMTEEFVNRPQKKHKG